MVRNFRIMALLIACKQFGFFPPIRSTELRSLRRAGMRRRP